MPVKKIVCPVKKFHPKAKPPTHGSKHAACYDFYCVGGTDGMPKDQLKVLTERVPRDVEDMRDFGQEGKVIMHPGQAVLFRTGIAMAIEPGHACFFWDRSGMGGFQLIHRLAGVIDEDYRGEWLVRLINLSGQVRVIHEGDKIVQGVFQERIECEFPDVLDGELPESGRGTAGFGSTGA